MSKNVKAQAKRKRELAKLEKRQAKDQKRALRKTERAQPMGTPIVPTLAQPPAPPPPQSVVAAGRLEARPPLTLAEAVQRWKTSRILKPKTYR
jgi:hypothetical protein